MKAYLRCILIQQVAKFNKESGEWEENTRREVIVAENNYVINQTFRKKEIWLEEQQKHKIAITSKPENRLLFQK